MDDLLKVLVYIIAVVIYAIVKMKKKPGGAKQSTASKPAQKQPLPHTKPSKSFADVPPKKAAPPINETIKRLEKEINKSKETIKTEKHLRSGKVYQEVEKEERKSLERASLTYELPVQGVQDHFAKVQGYNEIKDYESGYKDTPLLFEYPEEEATRSNPFAEYLKDPENVKKAFVMKEIFDRKHF